MIMTLKESKERCMGELRGQGQKGDDVTINSKRHKKAKTKHAEKPTPRKLLRRISTFSRWKEQSQLELYLCGGVASFIFPVLWNYLLRWPQRYFPGHQPRTVHLIRNPCGLQTLAVQL